MFKWMIFLPYYKYGQKIIDERLLQTLKIEVVIIFN